MPLVPNPPDKTRHATLSDAMSARQAADLPKPGFPPEMAQIEIEAKFLIEDAAQLGEVIDALQSHKVQSGSSLNVVDRYWDTRDWRLFKAGWTYRWRDASGKKNLTLKSIQPSDDLVRKRVEVKQQVVAFPEESTTAPLAGRFAEQLEGLQLRDLQELFRVHNTRRLFNIRNPDGAMIEIAIDRATVTTEGPVGKPAPGRLVFVELELELKEGREESLRQLAATIEQRFGLLPSRLSKFDRGLQTAGLSPPRLTRRWSPFRDTPFLQRLHKQELSSSDSATYLAYHRLLGLFEEMLCQEPKAWEGLDPEGVHRMRVSTRRLRAAFRAFKDVLPRHSIRSFNREFKWVAAALGEVRDLDVWRANLKCYAAQVPMADAAHLSDYQQFLADQWRKARRRLLACLRSPRYGRLKDRFAHFLEHGPSARAMKALGSVTISQAAPQLIGKRYQVVGRDGRAIVPGSPGDSLHRLRIQCKRLRYLFEFFQPIYGNLLKPEIKRLKKLKDVLGEFQDACVAKQQLRQYIEGVLPRTGNRGRLKVLEQLISAQNRRTTLCRAEFQQAWKQFDRKGAGEAVLTSLGKNPMISPE